MRFTNRDVEKAEQQQEQQNDEKEESGPPKHASFRDRIAHFTW